VLVAPGSDALAQTPSPAHVPARASSVRVIEQRHQITFGDEIRVTLEADAGTGEIVAVKGWFRPRGPGRISSYTYPDFVPGQRISASFSIKTGDTTYFPPGTEFDYRFELTDSSGNTTQTATQTVEYLDPRVSWKRQSRGPLAAVHYNLPDDRVAQLLDAAAARLPELARLTGADAERPYKAVLYRSVSDATPAFPRVSEAATDRQFFAGFAQPEFGLFVLGAPEVSTFVHELTHLFVDQALPSPLAAPMPSWLNEGLAVWAEGDGLQSLNSRIASAARSNRLLKLRAMGSIPGRASDISLFYPQAGAFVGYLNTRFGPNGLASLLRHMNEGRKVYDAAQEAWGVSLDDVENEWRASLGARPLPTPSPTTAPSSSPASTPGNSSTATPPTTAAPTPAPASTAIPATQTPSSSGTSLPTWALAAIAGGACLVVALAFALARRRRRQGTV